MLWGLARHEYGVIHYWFSLGFLVVLLLHLLLHWQWLTSVIGKRVFGMATGRKASIRAGLLTIIAIVSGFTVFAITAYRSVTDTSGNVICNTAIPSGNQPEAVSANSINNLPKTDFWKEVYPVLEMNCISCHGPRKQLGGFRADNRDDFFGKNGKEAFIVPGKSSESKLIEIISGRRPTMKSADAHILPAEDIRTITKWIDEGADWPQD